MALMGDLEALRRQNQELLLKLRLQAEKLQSLRAAGPGGGRGAGSGDSEPRSPGELPGAWGLYGARSVARSVALTEGNQADRVVTTVPAGERRPQAAREALCKPRSLNRAGHKPDKIPAETRTSAGRVTHQVRSSEDPYAPLLQDLRKQSDSTRQTQAGPDLLTPDKQQRGLNPVSCLSDQDLESTSERQHVQPLLGYDWIAGLLDAESSLTERSELFFSELRSFRQVNKDECVYSQSSSGLPVVAAPWSTSAEEEADQEHTPDTHQCTFCYRVNNRLFAAPLDPQAACPVCKMPKSRHPHTEQEPAFIRVSIPRSTLLPAYRYRAHRRSSFDPSDSLGLPSHCLYGWSNSNLKTGSQMSSLDLRSSMMNITDTGLVTSAQPEKQLDVSVSRAAGSQRSDQLLDVSRLARYRFQHLGPERTKDNKSAYPVY